MGLLSSPLLINAHLISFSSYYLIPAFLYLPLISPVSLWSVNKVPSLSARNTQNVCINMRVVRGRGLCLATLAWLLSVCALT